MIVYLITALVLILAVVVLVTILKRSSAARYDVGRMVLGFVGIVVVVFLTAFLKPALDDFAYVIGFLAGLAIYLIGMKVLRL